MLDILVANRFSRTIIRAPQIRNLVLSAGDAARPVECSKETYMNVANGIATRVSKTDWLLISAI